MGKAASVRKRKMGTEQHIAGIEQAHRLFVNDSEPILAKIPAPPARMKQPELGDDIAPLAMAAWQASATDGARRAIPGCAEAPQLFTARQALRQKLGEPGKEINERIGIAGERRPETPGMGGEDMHAFSPRRGGAPGAWGRAGGGRERRG